MDRKTREELNALSKEVFGVPSKWQKFLKGVPEPVTKMVTERVKDKDGKETEVTRQVYETYGKKHQKKVFIKKYYTIEEIKNLMVAIKNSKEEALKKQKETEEQQKLNAEVQNVAGGSSLA